MQSFSSQDFISFKKYFHIQDSPWYWDEKYLTKTQKYTKFFSKIPWILFIGVGNSTSMNAGKKESDIDLFIITKKNSMWFVRIVITFLTQFFWVRKTSKHHEARFCLSFFCEETHMNFSDFTVKNDIYLYFWIVYLKPILNYNWTYEKFVSSQTWADFWEYQDQIQENKKYCIFEKNIWNKTPKMLTYINIVLKSIFLPKTLKTYETLKKPYGIIIQSNILKFHNHDIRKGLYNTIKNI